MARIIVTDSTLTVGLSAWETVGSLHRDVTVPRDSVRAVHVAANGLSEVSGFRAPGTFVPWVVALGTFWRRSGREFAVAYRSRPAVVIELENAKFRRMVVATKNPEADAHALASP